MKKIIINLLAATAIFGAISVANADSQYSTANYQKNLTSAIGDKDSFTTFDEQKYPKANIESQDITLLMQADIALAQGAYAVAADPYYNLAMKYKDPRMIYKALVCYQQSPYNAVNSQRTANLVQALLNVAPDADISRLYAVSLSLEQNNFPAAKKNLDFLISNNKDQASSIFLFIAALLSDTTSRFDNSSVTQFGDYVADKYSKYPEGLLVASIAYSDMGDSDKLRNTMKQIYKQHSDWEFPVFWNAGILVKEKNLSLLESVINDEVVRRKSPSANMQNLFVAVYVKVNQVDKANQYILNSDTYKKGDTNMLVNKAIVDYELGDKGSALSLLKHVESSQENLGGALDFAIASLQALNNNRSDAIQHFMEASSANQVFTPSAGVGIIHSYVVESNFAAADKYIDSMPKRSDKDVAKTVLLAKLAIYTQLYQYKYAYQLAKQNIKQYKKDKEFYYLYVSLSGLSGNTQEAVKLYKQFIKENPKMSAGYNDLAYILAEQTTNYAEALQYAKKAYALAPHDHAVLDTIGWVEYKNKNYNAAEKYAEQAYALMPDNETSKHLKAIYLANNKPEKAAKITVSDLTPDQQFDQQLADQSMMLLMYYQFGEDIAKL